MNTAALALVSGVLLTGACMAADGAADGSGADDAVATEIRELRAALQVLQARLAALEAKAHSPAPMPPPPVTPAPAPATAVPAPAVAESAGRVVWRGDFRYRDETIHQQYAADRNRDRLRLRFGFQAPVNDSVRFEMQLATGEGGDPRAANQSLGGVNARKRIDLDLAFAQWRPVEGLAVVAGKMNYPWLRPGQSALFDTDIHPEGLAALWTGPGLFGSAFHLALKENSAGSESTLTGGQAGYRWQLGNAGGLVLAGSHFRFNNLRGQNVFWDGGNAAFGNTLVNGSAGDACYSALYSATIGRLCYEYRLTEVLAEYSMRLAGRPLVLYADVIRNTAAANGLDQAWSAGAAWGQALVPGSWEIGAFWQDIGKDAVFAQFVDSDFGGGMTDAEGLVLRAAYAPLRNWTLNATWFLNRTQLDRPAPVEGQGLVYDRAYRRLQLDLNFKF